MSERESLIKEIMAISSIDLNSLNRMTIEILKVLLQNLKNNN